MQFSFSKYVGCGNDFILIDNRNESFPHTNIELVKRLCNRNQGIGADGIILLENPTVNADARMRIFNADGSEAEMCGNGIRCFARYLQELSIPGPNYKIQTFDRLLNVQVNTDDVSVEMGPPTDMLWSIPLKIESKSLIVHYLNTGVPHTVFFVEDVEGTPLHKLGPAIRYDAHFAPKGSNVNIAAIDQKNRIYIRTYERGVEGETLACGTGATATALAAAAVHQLQSPITIVTKSGEELVISFQNQDSNFSDVVQTGPARKSFDGTFKI
jgi:diaminopimelate epimerase